jgi:cytochrome c oxidase cbb3-type subunit 2
MNRSNRILFGLLLVFLLSWLGFVLAPYIQIGRLLPDIDDVTKDQTPPQFPGIADEGRAVYAANGCVYCHSQQVQSRADGSDIDREWGARRTVARDYLDDRAVYLGSSRIGPDLANVGVRKDANDPAKYSEAWFYAHLYDPESVVPGSICPPLPFLFDRQAEVGQPALAAIQVGGGSEAAGSGKDEVVPNHDAKALVAYLLALKRSSYKLPEAPEEAAEQP